MVSDSNATFNNSAQFSFPGNPTFWPTEILPPNNLKDYVFDGKNMPLRRFMLRTQSVLEGYPGASERIKFNYLLNVVQGEELDYIQMFELSDKPYSGVWKVLSERTKLENHCLLILVMFWRLSSKRVCEQAWFPVWAPCRRRW